MKSHFCCCCCCFSELRQCWALSTIFFPLWSYIFAKKSSNIWLCLSLIQPIYSKCTLSLPQIGNKWVNIKAFPLMLALKAALKICSKFSWSTENTRVGCPVGVLLWVVVKINDQTIFRPILASQRHFRSFTNLRLCYCHFI